MPQQDLNEHGQELELPHSSNQDMFEEGQIDLPVGTSQEPLDTRQTNVLDSAYQDPEGGYLIGAVGGQHLENTYEATLEETCKRSSVCDLYTRLEGTPGYVVDI